MQVKECCETLKQKKFPDVNNCSQMVSVQTLVDNKSIGNRLLSFTLLFLSPTTGVLLSI